MYRIRWLILIVLAAMPVYAQNPSLPADLEPISAENVTRIHELAAMKGLLPIQKLVWSSDGERLAVLRGNFVLTGEHKHNSVEIWNFQNDNLPTLPDILFIPETVDELHWLPDSLSLVAHGEQDMDDKAHFLVTKWAAQTRAPLKTLMDVTVTRPLFYPYAYAEEKYYRQATPPILAWNHAYTESVSHLGNVGLRFSDGHMYRADYPDRYGYIHSVAWTPDDQFIIVDYGGDDTYHIEVLEADTLKSVLLADGDDYFITNIAWSPDNLSFAVASRRSNGSGTSANVRFYRIGSPVFYGEGEIILSELIPDDMPGGQPYGFPLSLAWSSDGSLIAIKFPAALDFYLPKTYTKVATIPDPTINAVAWHPGGKFLVTGHMGGSIHVWGVESAQ